MVRIGFWQGFLAKPSFTNQRLSGGFLRKFRNESLPSRGGGRAIFGKPFLAKASITNPSQPVLAKNFGKAVYRQFPAGSALWISFGRSRLSPTKDRLSPIKTRLSPIQSRLSPIFGPSIINASRRYTSELLRRFLASGRVEDA